VTLTINEANQDPVASDFDIGNLTQTVGNVTPVTVTPKTDKSNGTVTIYYNGSTTLPSAVGIYEVTFNVAAVSGWNAVNGLSGGTLTVNPATPVASDFDIGNLIQTFGSITAVTITPKSGKSSGAVTVYYNGLTALPTTVGTYPVTFDVDAVTGWNAASRLSAGTLTVNPATPVASDFTIGNLAQTFGSVTPVTITPKTGKSTGAITIRYNGSTTLPTAVGTHTVSFDVDAVTGWNAVTWLDGGTLTINKASGATVNVPALNTKTHNSITINPVTAPANGQSVEYAINTVNSALSLVWQPSTTFTGLNAGTTYYVFARAAENDNYAAAASNSLSVTTLQPISEGRIEYYWVDLHDSLVTTSGGVTTVAAGESLIITAQGLGYVVRQWRLDGVDTGHSGNTYTFSSTIDGKHTVGLFVEKDGKLYNTNITITVTPGRTINIDMYDSGGDGWYSTGALRINVNGVDIATNVRVQTSSNTYTFTAAMGDNIQVYWVTEWDYQQEENSFIVYYADTPPSPAFATDNLGPAVWTGNNALVYRLRNTMNSINGGTLLGSFTVTW
jgi:hypothetical protein